MIINYFRIALRHLYKNRIFSLINLFGLTLGFLCFTLLSLYVYDELSFDMFHKDAERIYRVIQHETKEDGSVREVFMTSARIGHGAEEQIPEVEESVKMYALGRRTYGNDPAARDYEVSLTMDPNFFTMLNFPFVEGDPKTALTEIDGVVVSEDYAKKYLGNDGPYLGKLIWSDINRDGKEVYLHVTGVFKNVRKNSHLQFNMVFTEATWRTLGQGFVNYIDNDWRSNNFVTYLKLREGAGVAAAEQKLTELVKKNYPKDREFRSTFSLQPMKDIHMYSSHLQGETGPTNDIKPFYIYMFAVVGALILAIACLNYMNLSTASAFRRVREIGTRKALGAMKTQLIFQFAGEAFILSIISLFFALALLQIVLPFVNQFAEKELALENLPATWLLGLGAVIILSGILSAVYPSFIVSKVSAVEAFKKEVKIGNRSLPMRKILVASQFAISIMMIACTIVIYQQLDFLRSKDVGFNKDNLVVIDINSRNLRRNFEQVKAEFSSIPEVVAISASTRVPGEWKSFPIATVKVDGTEPTSEMIFVGIDHDFLSTFDIKLVAGRNFLPGQSDSTKVILTQQGAKELGIEDPIGKMINIPGYRWGGSYETPERPFQAEVIGIAADFFFESFRTKQMPVIFAAPNTQIQAIDYYTLRVKSSNMPATIDKLKQVNLRIDPNNPIEYTFLDKEVFDTFYRLDEKRGQIFLVFSGIIICIASLGLFALVSYSIESRMKEIGVRKVLGATISNIVTLVSKEFVILVAISGVIALPAAWYMMTNWLNDFQYRVGLGAGVFIMALAVALIIAFTTVCFRAIKAGKANPVNSLRSE
jgi:putative ABC transport system permease protein